jgi:hypothetical protein
MPPNVLEKLLPEYVSPLVAVLRSEKLEDTAQIYAVGGGYVSRVAALTYGPSTTYQMCRLAETAPPTPPTARS